MNGTGRNGENSNYLVILLLVVGLTAFSHSMKELTEIHHLTLDASRVIAQWSGNVTPVEIPQTVVKVEKHESCDSKQSAPSVELPWLNETPSATEPNVVVPTRSRQIRIERIHTPVITLPSAEEIAKLKKLPRFEFDADEFEVRVPANAPNVDSDEPIAVDLSQSTFKAKARKHNLIRINPRDREMLLKTLNRSINLRIAG